MADINKTYLLYTYLLTYLLHKILTALIQESCIVQTHAKCDLLFDPVTLTLAFCIIAIGLIYMVRLLTQQAPLLLCGPPP